VRMPGQRTVRRVAQMTDAVSEEMTKMGILSRALHFSPAQAGCIKRPSGGANVWGGTSAEPRGPFADSGISCFRLREGNRGEVGSLDGTSGRHRDSYDDILSRRVESEGLALLADPFEVIEGSMNLADSPQTRCRRKGVTEVAVRISQQLHLSVEDAAEIRQAAALHDFGKAVIPAAILYKPMPLTAKSAPQYGPTRSGVNKA